VLTGPPKTCCTNNPTAASLSDGSSIRRREPLESGTAIDAGHSRLVSLVGPVQVLNYDNRRLRNGVSGHRLRDLIELLVQPPKPRNRVSGSPRMVEPVVHGGPLQATSGPTSGFLDRIQQRTKRSRPDLRATQHKSPPVALDLMSHGLNEGSLTDPGRARN
jgi:hypothetical protein